MMSLNYSFIVPVYNRPDEVFNLLQSLSLLSGGIPFEVVIVEDGSREPCKAVCERFRESVTINYYFKENTGPGDSRNYGMRSANGNYFIILDSDCIVPPAYLEIVHQALSKDFVHCFGGPDAAHERFSNLQKAINYTMTSFWTTGGIRGGSEQLDKFQPRSFNMGLSKEAFEKTGGFGRIHPGEDPDLVLRLWKEDYKTKLLSDAFVYHERRISWKLFFKQVNKFGKVRVILNKWHPQSKKLAFTLPSAFVVGLIVAIVLGFAGWYLPLAIYVFYVFVLGVHSTFKNNVVVGCYSMIAALIQFTGYGLGYIHATLQIHVLGRNEQVAYPQLFFKERKLS